MLPDRRSAVRPVAGRRPRSIPHDASLTTALLIATGVACDLIVRNPSTGSLVSSGYVVTTYVNAAYLQTSGTDFTAPAPQKLGDIFGGDLGRIDLNSGGTRTEKYEVQVLPGAQVYRCDGYFGVTCGQPIPPGRHRLLVSWASRFSFGGTFRYVFAGVTERF